MLSFHHQCFEEFFPNLTPTSTTTSTTASPTSSSSNQASQDAELNGGLLVMGRGLGEWRVIVQMFRLCCTPGPKKEVKPLLLVINGTSEFNGWRHLCEWWGKIPREFCPKQLDATTLSSKRATLYAEGGCFFVTSRILVADLLNGVFRDNLTGVIVLRAHLVTESSNEAFAIRMVRQKSPKSFVRAFSEFPEKLSNGFSKLSLIMKSLGIRKLFLYPRFRQEVRDCLDSASPVLSEIAQPLSDSMREIQSSAVEAIKLTVEEIRRSASVDVSDLTVETSLFRAFDLIIKQKLSYEWSAVSAKSKQLIEDLQALRQILKDLLSLDCVSFYEKLQDVKRKSAESPQHSMWLITDAGDRLFRHAKLRLYSIDSNTKTLKVNLEPHLKIDALEQVLIEIRDRQRTMPSVSLEILGGADVICLVRDERTLVQVSTFLNGKHSKALPVLERRFLNYLTKAVGNIQAATLEQTLLQQEMERLNKLKSERPAPTPRVKMSDTHFHPKTTYVPPAKGESAEVSFLNRADFVAVHLLSELGTTGLLDAMRPRFIILFDPDVGAMREVECYYSLHQHLFPAHQIHLYILFYESSVEEQRHLSSLNQEREAFIRVIQEKSELVFAPEPNVSTNTGEELTMTYDASTGQMVPALKKKRMIANQGNKAIVDIRELRSTLPNMLHSANFTLDARTLEVGDYILSPDICVERKAIPDLIDSLKTGRLFRQATMMTRHYRKPCVLIEFSDAGPFRLQSDTTAELSQVTLMSRIVLFNLHFPDIKLLWSKSGRATVDLFRELQKNQPSPDGDVAEKIEATGAGQLVSDVPNMEAFELLKQLPGITKDNVYRVARGAGSLADLCKLDLDSIVELCQSEPNARLLFEFLHRES